MTKAVKAQSKSAILNQFTESDGRQLAVDMLRELEERWGANSDLLDPDNDFDDHTEILLSQEPDIMRRYFAAVRSKKSQELEHGFLCVLSEFIGGALNGCPLDLEDYQRCLESHR